MPQTRMTAKNTFGAGLIMDFAPDNVLSNVLTNALNATFHTYNGNEESLQNDMGNGRVETAFLPLGYIPMGATSFGGIIYIVSYNPLEDLCLVGCFPSPERNITSDEVINSTQGLKITNSDFVDGNGNINTLVKKVLLRLDNLNPGDKYAIFFNGDLYSEEEYNRLTGLLKNSDSLILHKILNIRVVSIDDNGKIEYLDNTTVNNSVKISGENGIYKFPKTNLELTVADDVDTYRKMVSQLYSVFSSRHPGQLALLAELETILEFSCGHHVKTITGDDYIKFEVYCDFSWETDYSEVNPEYLIVDDVSWKAEKDSSIQPYIDNIPIKLKRGESTLIQNIKPTIKTNEIEVYVPTYERNTSDEKVTETYYTIKDISTSYKTKASNSVYAGSVYNNGNRVMYFRENANNSGSLFEVNSSDLGDVYINNDLNLTSSFLLCSFYIPKNFTKNGLNFPFVLPAEMSYTITPAMSFGRLAHMSVTNTIDFSKVNTFKIDIDEYKYYCTSDLITLNLGSDIYEEEGHLVTKVALEFFDALGFVGSKSITGRDSYSGNITLNLALDTSKVLDRNRANGTEDLYHYVGNNINEPWLSDEVSINKAKTSEINDCGELKSNMLYGVRIIYYYSEINPITFDIIKTEERVKYRWLYTTGLYNSDYYTISDFSELLNSVPIMFSYKLVDGTKKLVTLDLDSYNKISTIVGATESVDISELREVGNYSGDISAEVYLGTDVDSPFKLNNIRWDNLPEITIKLVSPLEENKSHSIIEVNDNLTILLQDSSFKFSKGNSSYYTEVTDSNLTVRNTIKVNVNNLLHISNLENIQSQIVPATVLTPICFTEDGSAYNYDEIGVDLSEHCFKKTLIYNGSDDNKENAWDMGWYEGVVQLGKITSVSAMEVTNNIKNWSRNLYEGKGDVSERYLSSLGNRQPFSLFALQRVPGLLRDNDSSKNLDKSVQDNLYVERGKTYIRRSNDLLVKHKDYDLFTTLLLMENNVKNKALNVYMTSSGGPVKSDGTDIPYSGLTSTNLKTFCNNYIERLKNIYTVNNSINSVNVILGELNKENMTDKALVSCLLAKADLKVDNIAKYLLFNDVNFETYVTNITSRLQELSINDNNIVTSPGLENIGGTDSDGEDKYVLLTNIQYSMPHEHYIIESYIGNLELTVARYWDSNKFKYVILDNNIDSSKFYFLYNNNLHCMSTGNYIWTYNKPEPIGPSVSQESSKVKYYPYKIKTVTTEKEYKVVYKDNLYSILSDLDKYSLFANSTFTVEDFVWDPEDNNHHMYFVNTNNCTACSSEFRYLIDDGDDNNNIDKGWQKADSNGCNKYMIGPSFRN